ncbi:hypothetical protein PIB30_074138 [Stylosanthes scabra]|uniref:Uncharacterized protein n=1 Tax=Stylosanthes scabra TaxID=79078 RepID=A0ABU6YQX9_9FABA|nr:hypothetical protein [Stylosanthes scabra]
MAKKKSCQTIRAPRVLSEAERDLYGWVDEEIFAQSSVVGADMIPELRREMSLTVDRAAEGDFVLEAAGPSDRLPFRGRKLFDSFKESIQEFKWHYFKVLPLPGRQPFWLDDEGTPFPWVYWNSEVRDYRITALDPLETLAFEFLQSLPAGLVKKSSFKCRWILDHSDAIAGVFLEAALGTDSGWEHKVNPIDRAFPAEYNFRAALDSGLTQGPIREILGPLLPEQLLGTAQYLACKLTACLQLLPLGFDDLIPAASYVGIENAFAAKVGLEELAATKDQVDVLTAERNSASAAPLVKAKIDSLTEELRFAEGERLSALARMKEVEEGAKEKKKVGSVTRSLEQKQTALDEAEVATGHWREELKALAEETGEMVKETFEILMDQVRHLNPAIDFSMTTLDTRSDPKDKRIYNPKAEIQE